MTNVRERYPGPHLQESCGRAAFTPALKPATPEEIKRREKANEELKEISAITAGSGLSSVDLVRRARKAAEKRIADR
jgi:hypothetical protein